MGGCCWGAHRRESGKALPPGWQRGHSSKVLTTATHRKLNAHEPCCPLSTARPAYLMPPPNFLPLIGCLVSWLLGPVERTCGWQQAAVEAAAGPKATAQTCQGGQWDESQAAVLRVSSPARRDLKRPPPETCRQPCAAAAGSTPAPGRCRLGAEAAAGYI
jgi:hypothetical protein